MTTLLVANVGGHLKELHLLRDRLGIDGDVLWLTNATAQSESLLEGERVIHVPYARSRGVRDMLMNGKLAARRLRGQPIERAVSTGASLALSTFPVLAARGIPCHFIESATRISELSMSGKLLARLPNVATYTQSESLRSNRWQYRGSVFDGYEVTPLHRAPDVRRVVVSVGSSHGYGFRSLIERTLDIIPSGVEVLWQTGSTVVSDLPIQAKAFVSAVELEQAIAESDAVIMHAGTGSALGALEAGQLPILIPRARSRHEHVDDHQFEVAKMLHDRGLAVVEDPHTLTWDHVLRSARYRVIKAEAPLFVLDS